MYKFICDLITPDELYSSVKLLKEKGYRLVQICCTQKEKYEILYSFDKDFDLVNLKIILDENNREIKSITNVYWNAFVYENEMHDLYGIKVKGINIDYKGNFYQTKVKWPFARKEGNENG